MDLIEGINEKHEEFKNIVRQIRELTARQAEILSEFQQASVLIGEIKNSVNTKPATIPISNIIGLDELTRKCLMDKGIVFLEDFTIMTELAAQRIPGLGAPAFDIIRAAMLTHDLNFAT